MVDPLYKEIAQEIGADNSLIAGNGAIVFDIKQNKVMYGKYLAKEKVIEIIKACKENDIFYNIYLKECYDLIEGIIKDIQ